MQTSQVLPHHSGFKGVVKAKSLLFNKKMIQVDVELTNLSLKNIMPSWDVKSKE